MMEAVLSRTPILAVTAPYFPWAQQLERSLFDTACDVTATLGNLIEVRRDTSSSHIATLSRKDVRAQGRTLDDLQTRIMTRWPQVRVETPLGQIIEIMRGVVDQLSGRDWDQIVAGKTEDKAGGLQFHYAGDETPLLAGIRVFLGLSLAPVVPETFWDDYGRYAMKRRGRGKGPSAISHRFLDHRPEEVGLGAQAALAFMIHPFLARGIDPSNRFLLPDLEAEDRQYRLRGIHGCGKIRVG